MVDRFAYVVSGRRFGRFGLIDSDWPVHFDGFESRDDLRVDRFGLVWYVDNGRYGLIGPSRSLSLE